MPTHVPADPPARPRGRDRGATPIELALLLPVIIIALFSSIQVAVYFLARAEALGAAQEAVTAQRAYGAPAGVGQARATSFLGGNGRWLVRPTVTVDTTSRPFEVSATVGGTALSLIPGVTFTISQVAHGTVERTTGSS